MSELINNRAYRQKVIKELITKLHNGSTVEEVKAQFAQTFEGVSASEISEVEQSLIAEGMPVSEVQRLCDVHAAVFKGSIEDIHKEESKSVGHPLGVMKSENQAIQKIIRERIEPHLLELTEGGGKDAVPRLQEDIEDLSKIEIHYKKKENVFFSYLERYGVTAPPKVMWGVDDEILKLIKDAKAAAEHGQDFGHIQAKLREAVSKIEEMIFKEENILFPMMTESLTEEEWRHIAVECEEFGYCLIAEPPEYKPVNAAPAKPEDKGAIRLPSGVLKIEEVICLLNTLPVDITFVDKDDTVKYFSQGKERIFPRTTAIIGRKVENCHPPASVHIVLQVVEDLKSGKKEHEDFWIRLGEKYVFIRYFAVRNQAGEYLGTLEVSQDIGPIQAIKGEKRLATEQ